MTFDDAIAWQRSGVFLKFFPKAFPFPSTNTMARSDRTSEFLDAVKTHSGSEQGKPKSRNLQKLKDREREETSIGEEYLANAYTVVSFDRV